MTMNMCRIVCFMLHLSNNFKNESDDEETVEILYKSVYMDNEVKIPLTGSPSYIAT